MSKPAGAEAKPWEHAKSGEGSASDALAARFVESLSYDTRLYRADIRGSTAHAEMLHAVGLLTSPELGAIRRGLAEIQREIEGSAAGPTAVGVAGAWPGWRFELEDVHMCIEAALIAKIGEPGRRLHTGRSRNDQVALDLRLWLREAAEELAQRGDQVLRALEGLAGVQGEIVMPGYTHLQRAQPICLGGELMAWHAMIERDVQDLLRLAGSNGACPLGSGAVAGSSLGLDRARVANDLGFTGPSSSSIDSTASRDEALDFLYVLSRCAMHLSRWAEQWIIYCTTEFGFLRLDERYTTGSSMMPQKRNPDMLELIRGRCGNVYGSFVALLTICKGLPIAYNRDLQEDKRHVFAAYDMLGDSLEMAGRIIATARFDGGRIGATLRRGHLDATGLAEALVREGVAFRTAHQVVGALVRRCEESGREALSDLPTAEVAAELAARGITPVQAQGMAERARDGLGAEQVAASYATHGSAGAVGYKQALAEALAKRGIGGLGAQGPRERAVSGAPSIAPGARAIEANPEKSGAGPDSTNAPAPAAAAAAPSGTASTAAGGSAADLFGGGVSLAAQDEMLTEAYTRVGRTLDDLPYTPEFERILRAIDRPSKPGVQREVFHRLQNLRKAGKLPRVGRATSSPPMIKPDEEAALEAMVIEAAGSLGQRDTLPFTQAFDGIVERFNQRFSRALDPHDVWRLIAKLAK